MQAVPELDQTILVVPYTDSGCTTVGAGWWADCRGRGAHGAIVAREYGIPAVMDIHNATALCEMVSVCKLTAVWELSPLSSKN